MKITKIIDLETELTCPKCGGSWDEGDVMETLLRDMKPNQSLENVREWAENFGWTPENGRRFRSLIAIYDRDRDRTVRHMCPYCKTQWDRDTGLEIETNS